jgi:hypothetical protein
MAYAAGKYLRSLVAADLNGDGKLDLAVASTEGSEILLGNGDGSFQAPMNNEPAGYAVAVGDFNGDGVPDLAVSPPGGIAILLGKGGGVFPKPPASYQVLSNPVFAVAADFNGDGKADLAVADSGSNGVSILLNNGSGSFQPGVGYAVLKEPTCVAVGDFNGDGKPDLAVADGGSAAVSILLGNGDGTFRRRVDYSAGSAAGLPQSVVVADFNGDGKPDLAIGRGGATYGISVLLGNGDGTFQPPLESFAIYSPAYVAAADFNGDGIPDLAVIANSEFVNGIYVLPGNGDGTFGAPVFTAVEATPTPMTVADFNGDGIPDLVFGGFVYLGNGDGTFRG